MARIVCIGTNVTAKCAVDDVVSIYDDGIGLGGPGYAASNIYEVKGLTGAQVQAKFSELQPERKPAFKLPEGNKWMHEQPEEIWTWKNSDGKWCELKEDPKYKVSFSSLSKEDKANLADKNVLGIVTLSILDKCSENIHRNEVNNVEIPELNGAIK